MKVTKLNSAYIDIVYKNDIIHKNKFIVGNDRNTIRFYAV